MLNSNWKSKKLEIGEPDSRQSIRRLTLGLIISLGLLAALATLPHPW